MKNTDPLLNKWFIPKDVIIVHNFMDSDGQLPLYDLTKPFKIIKVPAIKSVYSPFYVEIKTLDQNMPIALYKFNAIELKPYIPNEIETILFN